MFEEKTPGYVLPVVLHPIGIVSFVSLAQLQGIVGTIVLLILDMHNLLCVRMMVLRYTAVVAVETIWRHAPGSAPRDDVCTIPVEECLGSAGVGIPYQVLAAKVGCARARRCWLLSAHLLRHL
jgi:hypothetical protein